MRVSCISIQGPRAPSSPTFRISTAEFHDPILQVNHPGIFVCFPLRECGLPVHRFSLASLHASIEPSMDARKWLEVNRETVAPRTNLPEASGSPREFVLPPVLLALVTLVRLIPSTLGRFEPDFPPAALM